MTDEPMEMFWRFYLGGQDMSFADNCGLLWSHIERSSKEKYRQDPAIESLILSIPSSARSDFLSTALSSGYYSFEEEYGRKGFLKIFGVPFDGSKLLVGQLYHYVHSETLTNYSSGIITDYHDGIFGQEYKNVVRNGICIRINLMEGLLPEIHTLVPMFQ